MEVKVVNKSNHRLPEYKTPYSAGMDLKANISEPIVLKPGERQLIPTGLHIQLPKNHYADIRPRSGLAVKNGVFCALGLIDEDYIGDLGVILFNFGQNNFIVNPGDRIAQLVVSKYEHVEWKEVAELDKTERGDSGFGSTGI